MCPTQAEATKKLDGCFRKMYLAPLWIPAAEAREIATLGQEYLELFQAMAIQAANEGKRLFLFNAKVHMMCHIMRNLSWESELASLCLNPMVWGVQLEEDLIGKAARVTRHVSSHPSFTMRRTLQRWLIASYSAWSKVGMLQRI